MKTIAPKVKHEFTFNAPDVMSVMLIGDFTDWQKHPVPLKRLFGGAWKATLELSPGTYRYRFHGFGCMSALPPSPPARPRAVGASLRGGGKQMTFQERKATHVNITCRK